MSPLTAAEGGPRGNQVKKAGSQIRRARRDGIQDIDAYIQAIETIARHRATFKTPLVTANNGLRSMVKTLGLDGRVSQRLKRMSTILEKLTREPNLALDRMQDIGGCRVVLSDRASVYTLAGHIAMLRPTLRVSDYIESPRQSGYRGLHVVVEYGRCPRPIEVQLRTPAMHQWATTVEDISGNSGINYKMDGASPMQVFLECYARVLKCIDLGTNPPSSLVDEYETLLNRAFGQEHG